MTTTTAPTQATDTVVRSRVRTRGAAAAGAVSAALAVWAVTGPVLGVELVVSPGGDQPQSVGPAAVAASSLVAALAGWALLAVLERFTARARTAWTVIALAVLALSLIPLQAAATMAAAVALAAMHLAVAVVLIPVLATTAPSAAARR